MATFRLRHFSRVKVLRDVEPRRLLTFLRPYREFLSEQGYDLPDPNVTDEIDYQKLIAIFMSPGDKAPRDLFDALFLVDEMSSDEGMEVLIDAANQAGLTFEHGDDHSPADIAIQIWLLDRDLLERKHAEKPLRKRTSFDYYEKDSAQPSASMSLLLQLKEQFEKELDDWFEKKKRGRGARLFPHPGEREVRFLVRHGEPFKREESITNAEVSSVCYRPLKYDVVVYDYQLAELRINARLVGETNLYRQLFGEYLFGDKKSFRDARKYNLHPLRDLGEDCLACGDIDGIESISLTEVEFYWGKVFDEREIRKAADVFAALKSRNKHLPERATIVKAVFKVKFTDSKTPRVVTILPPNTAKYTRDSDADLIEQWLTLRGFTEKKGVRKDVATALSGH
jgi:hypothetical protein